MEFEISSKETSRIFTQSLSCSQALMTTLDKAFGKPNPAGEQAAHPLAGGLVHMGYQCGMLWGSNLAAGSEAFRRYGPGAVAEAAAVAAAKELLESFKEKAGSHNCRDITRADFSKISGRLKYIFTGGAMNCTRLSVKWAPAAFKAIDKALEAAPKDAVQSPVSCASVTAKRLGASDEEAVACAGFAGGIGLSGNACGALATAVWIATLKWYRENPDVDESFLRALRQEMSQKIDFYPPVRAILKKFAQITGGKYLCSEITGKQFNDIKSHSDFLANGGCKDIIEAF